MAGPIKEFYNNSKILNAVRYRITPFMIKKKKKHLLFDNSEFYRLNLNCRGDAYYRYVNIEDKRTKGRVFVSPMHSLPFSEDTVKFIIADFETLRDKKNKWGKIFKDWSRVLVSNGVLVLDNIFLDDEIQGLLRECNFLKVSSGLDKNLPVANFVNNKKLGFYKKDVFFYKIKEKELQLSSRDDFGGTSIDLKGICFLEEGFINIKIKNIVEYLYPDEILYFFKKLAGMLNKDALIELEIWNEVACKEGRNVSFFDKANLSLLFTELGFRMERIENLDGYIKASVAKEKISPVNLSGTRKKRLCFIERFLMFRHNYLGFDNDAIARACGELGLDSLLIEGMRNIDFSVLKKAILSHRPEYLIFRHKEILPFIFYIKDDLKKIGTKVAFWFCDPSHPDKKDFSDLIDVMFLSNRGQLAEYKEAYNINRIYYMPQGFAPYAIHRIKAPEVYDIGFAGAVSKEDLHQTRRALIEALKERYNVKITNNVRNDISEFYSLSKIVFGTSDFGYELYTSNRFFIALGCGACYITKRFKGIELLTENKRHILWFEAKDELFDILDYYLSHDSEREKIKQAAASLALEKHTYVHRMKNILDILEGKTESFYGFL